MCVFLCVHPYVKNLSESVSGCARACVHVYMKCDLCAIIHTCVRSVCVVVTSGGLCVSLNTDVFADALLSITSFM